MTRRSALAVLLAIGAACGGSAPAAPTTAATPSSSSSQQGCLRTSVGLTPLSELGPGGYRGQRGGLYPDGGSTPPAPHLDAGLALARAVGPLDADGRPSA